MTIRDVLKATGLTRKAVEYYEQQELITPARTNSGYRLYDEATVATLREIALLRRLGLKVIDIRSILQSPDKSARLRDIETHMATLEDRRSLQQKGLSRLIQSGYDIAATADYVGGELDALSPSGSGCCSASQAVSGFISTCASAAFSRGGWIRRRSRPHLMLSSTFSIMRRPSTSRPSSKP